ncbi:hypothetical protein EDEG_02559 [Edhazardia aedis USNM 41457]|uniref:Uncharacterized protein n=1 Tax=Edhazardia aedis (strain USNM 41457) TaxID=1003232 RepID=J9DKH0_EDHAE|nr:hypothetical protein EDEG_02559 [Edhazardia aedis USNM 41457]|eukprot:EJW03080.1 hypothetical protein EDEG_02559 [Edhazardia aedis USNM 41457]
MDIITSVIYSNYWAAFLYFNGFFHLKSTERPTEILTLPNTTETVQSTPTTTNAPISSSDLKRFGETRLKYNLWDFFYQNRFEIRECTVTDYRQVPYIGRIVLNNNILQLLFPNSDISNKDYDFKSYSELSKLTRIQGADCQYFYKIAFVDVSRKRSKQKKFRKEKQREEIRQSIS